MIGPRILEVRTRILKANDELARELRRGFEQVGRGHRVSRVCGRSSAGRPLLYALFEVFAAIEACASAEPATNS